MTILIEKLHIYNILYTMHMHTNIQIVRVSQEEGRQSLLRAEVKLVRFFHSAIKYIPL